MHCIHCQSVETKVVDSRSNDSQITRRRRCLKCLRTFGTIEIPVTLSLPTQVETMTHHLKAANLRLEQLQTELRLLIDLTTKTANT